MIKFSNLLIYKGGVLIMLKTIDRILELWSIIAKL